MGVCLMLSSNIMAIVSMVVVSSNAKANERPSCTALTERVKLHQPYRVIESFRPLSSVWYSAFLLLLLKCFCASCALIEDVEPAFTAVKSNAVLFVTELGDSVAQDNLSSVVRLLF